MNYGTPETYVYPRGCEKMTRDGRPHVSVETLGEGGMPRTTTTAPITRGAPEMRLSFCHYCLVALRTVVLLVGMLLFGRAQNAWAVPAMVSAGGATVVVFEDGTLWGWGSGYNPFPTQEGIATDWTQVSAAYMHNLAIKSDGTLWAWGRSYSDGTNTEKLSPSQVGNDRDWHKVATRFGVFDFEGPGGHTTAIKSDGTLWAWGWNRFGQLGDGTTTTKYPPTRLEIKSCSEAGRCPLQSGEERIQEIRCLLRALLVRSREGSVS
jgi:hypothetical protein